ncbi:hypothetical protein RYX36_027366 [Vicia faba]
MKRALFTVGTSFIIPMRERVVSLFTGPMLTSEPEVYSRVLKYTDRFIIFGSSGFWKWMSNELATRIVKCSPRDDIAKRLVIIAIEKGKTFFSKNGYNNFQGDELFFLLSDLEHQSKKRTSLSLIPKT